MKGLNERLDRMPTSELMTAYLARIDADMKSVRTDVTEAGEKIVETERRLDKRIDQAEARATEGKRLAWTVAGVGAAFFIGVLGIIVPLIGGGG